MYFLDFLINFRTLSGNQLELKSEISLPGKRKSPHKRVTSLEVSSTFLLKYPVNLSKCLRYRLLKIGCLVNTVYNYTVLPS
jgi:hypothetical protein